MSLSPGGWVLEDGVCVAVVRLAKYVVLIKACIGRVHTCRPSWGMRRGLFGKRNMLHRPLMTHCSGHPEERRFGQHWCGNTFFFANWIEYFAGGCVRKKLSHCFKLRIKNANGHGRV